MARFLRDVRDGNLAAVQRHLAVKSNAVRSVEPGVRTPMLGYCASFDRL